MPTICRSVVVLLVVADLAACHSQERESIDSIAREYVLLALQLNTHDEGYVDAYYGDRAWRDEAEASPAPMSLINERAEKLLAAADAYVQSEASEEFSRARYLQRQISAMLARIEILQGKQLSFDEEALAVYDSRPPRYAEAHFDSVLAEIDALVPGSGSLTDRVEAFRMEFVIPYDRLDAVLREAMNECRERTAAHIRLPEGERFTIEYVTDKPWSGYNWFKGDAVSLIQINTDSQVRIERAVDLACHEGYPGHHVLSILREKRFRDDGWVEFSLLPLYAPVAPIAEGSANYGNEVAFPGNQRVAYEREVLFPLAGLDASRADLYYRLLELGSALDFAQNEAARRYLSGEWDTERTVNWLMKYQLKSKQRARQTVRFIDTYRAYVINYNYGQELVRRYIDTQGATHDEVWEVFQRLLAAPVVPSDLY